MAGGPPSESVRLGRIARSRSGDKGTGSNIGVIADSRAAYQLLRDQLTAERVADFFRPMGVVSVERYELPNLGAFNFVIRGILARNTRVDAQGKAQQRTLRVSRAIGDKWLVSDGLRAGDRLIVEGLQAVRPGAAVRAGPVSAAFGAGQ